MALYLGSTAVKFGSATKTGTNEGTETEVVLQSKTVSPSTSLQTVLPDDGYNGLSQVTVNAIKTQSKSVTPSTSSQTVTPDSDFDGLSQVTVDAITTQSKSVSPTTSSQTVTPDDGYSGLSRVTVGAITTQSKSVTPTTSSQTVTPDDGYDGLNQVTVGAIPSDYVKPTSTQAAKTWTPSTSEQSIPAGTYCSGKQTISAMPTGALSTPSISVSSSGVITATSGVSTAGYLATSASKSGTKSLTTASGGTYTLSEGESVTRAAGTYLTSALSVTAAASSGSGYIGESLSLDVYIVEDNGTTYWNFTDSSKNLNTSNLMCAYLYCNPDSYDCEQKDLLISLFLDFVNETAHGYTINHEIYVNGQQHTGALLGTLSCEYSNAFNVIPWYPEDRYFPLSGWYMIPIYSA